MKNVVQTIDEVVRDFVKHSQVDYIGLWQIAKATKERLGARTLAEVREISLRISKKLYEQGLRPGDYDYAAHTDFWPDEGCQAMLDRIEEEWVKLDGDPTHLDPICAFLARPKDA